MKEKADGLSPRLIPNPITHSLELQSDGYSWRIYESQIHTVDFPGYRQASLTPSLSRSSHDRFPTTTSVPALVGDYRTGPYSHGSCVFCWCRVFVGDGRKGIAGTRFAGRHASLLPGADPGSPPHNLAVCRAMACVKGFPLILPWAPL